VVRFPASLAVKRIVVPSRKGRAGSLAGGLIPPTFSLKTRGNLRFQVFSEITPVSRGGRLPLLMLVDSERRGGR